MLRTTKKLYYVLAVLDRRYDTGWYVMARNIAEARDRVRFAVNKNIDKAWEWGTEVTARPRITTMRVMRAGRSSVDFDIETAVVEKLFQRGGKPVLVDAGT